ncbi:hypothetical protein OUZ56_025364 [Daphnia magna]|uniref:Uncharacterized protein n=1 Tax=Daphnia magna TaxID=35525 RepID=A0ABQ9ZJL9_9CRUS|nr:hypothetical protein OUZ56_025364 [Daphnia magna]
MIQKGWISNTKYLFPVLGEMMTSWLVGEESWRTRGVTWVRWKEKYPISSRTSDCRSTEDVQPQTELDPIDTSPSTWLLGDCPLVPNEDYE